MLLTAIFLFKVYILTNDMQIWVIIITDSENGTSGFTAAAVCHVRGSRQFKCKGPRCETHKYFAHRSSSSFTFSCNRSWYHNALSPYKVNKHLIHSVFLYCITCLLYTVHVLLLIILIYKRTN